MASLIVTCSTADDNTNGNSALYKLFPFS